MTNSKIVYWWLLILFIENGWLCCYCCWNEERTALLQLKANINYSTRDDYLSSWRANETSDCCQWEGIVCSNTTRRVIELSIIAKKISQEEQPFTLNGTNTDDILMMNWLFNASLFIPFKNLKALIIPGHSLASWVKNEGLFSLYTLPLYRTKRVILFPSFYIIWRCLIRHKGMIFGTYQRYLDACGC